MIRFIVNNKMEQILLKSLIKERILSFVIMLSRQHYLSKTFVLILIIACSACSVLIETSHSLSEDELNKEEPDLSDMLNDRDQFNVPNMMPDLTAETAGGSTVEMSPSTDINPFTDMSNPTDIEGYTDAENMIDMGEVTDMRETLDLDDPNLISPETQCDGVDNDQDQQIDEGVLNECGGCEVLIEECDNLDNDCDDLIDEDLHRSCGVDEGSCQTGREKCQNGVWGVCEEEIRAIAETCDNIDNDCDGVVDELISRSCGSNEGVCQEGVEVCAEGSWGSCEGGVLSVNERCNLLDDDCDGVVDEGQVCFCPTRVLGDQLYLFCGSSSNPDNPLDQPQRWIFAASRCESMGFHLTSINSSEENERLYNQLMIEGMGDTWIGLNDQTQEGQFEWRNQDPITYTNWDNNEPNNGVETEEDCGVLMTRTNRESFWDDRICTDAYPFICELDH